MACVDSFIRHCTYIYPINLDRNRISTRGKCRGISNAYYDDSGENFTPRRFTKLKRSQDDDRSERLYEINSRDAMLIRLIKRLTNTLLSRCVQQKTFECRMPCRRAFVTRTAITKRSPTLLNLLNLLLSRFNARRNAHRRKLKVQTALTAGSCRTYQRSATPVYTVDTLPLICLTMNEGKRVRAWLAFP